MATPDHQSAQQPENPVEPEVEHPVEHVERVVEVRGQNAMARQPGTVARMVFTAVLGVLIGQAGVIGYGAGSLGETARTERIYLDMQAIAGGLRDFSADGRFEDDGLQRVSWLYGPGRLPEEAAFVDEGGASALRDVNGSAAGAGQRDRYIQVLMPDPWGNAYLANVDGLQAGTQRIKVLSAGPDGVIETPPSATDATGDDILIHLF